MGLTCTVLGASGYSGGELLRLLAGHPALTVEAVAAGTKAGREVAEAQPHLQGLFDRFLPLAEVAPLETDVCFSCLPSGALDTPVEARVLVELGDDHRWVDGWQYGLTELARPSLAGAELIANPGCYPTAALLALLPFAKAGLIASPISIDGMSGISGAGRDPKDSLLFASASGSTAAYGTTSHRHIPEIERALQVWGGLEATVSFTPHLVPMARGLVVTARSALVGELTNEDAHSVLADAYRDEAFVHATREWPQTKAVAGSNHAHVHARVDERAGLLICSAAIDNLGKGAAGQALQNANLALGIEEGAGLGGLGVWP